MVKGLVGETERCGGVLVGGGMCIGGVWRRGLRRVVRGDPSVTEMVKRLFPGSSGNKRGEASFLSDAPIDKEALKNAIAATGYTCLSAEGAPYEKKGLFGR